MAKKCARASTSIHDEIFPGFSERSERGKRNRDKGTEFERKIARLFKPVFPRAARLYGQARDGDEVPDVGGTPFWIECGDGSTVTIHGKLAQGLAASATSPSVEYRGRPVVVVSHHRGLKETMATMRLSDFIQLIQKLDQKKR